MKTTSLKTTTTQTVYEFTRTEIVNALIGAGKLPHREGNMSIEAFVKVPGGGDWSNTDLDLAEVPLRVKVTTKEQEQT